MNYARWKPPRFPASPRSIDIAHTTTKSCQALAANQLEMFKHSVAFGHTGFPPGQDGIPCSIPAVLAQTSNLSSCDSLFPYDFEVHLPNELRVQPPSSSRLPASRPVREYLMVSSIELYYRAPQNFSASHCYIPQLFLLRPSQVLTIRGNRASHGSRHLSPDRRLGSTSKEDLPRTEI